MKPARYVYPATIGYDAPTKQYYVLWPDLPGCTTVGDTEEEALQNAREAMSLHLYSIEKSNDEMPSPSSIVGIQHDSSEAVVLVDVWMPSFREKMETTAMAIYS